MEEKILAQANKCFANKEYEKACKWYDTYFQKVYKEGTTLTTELAKNLLKYAEALISKEETTATNGKYDTDELDTAVEYILLARETFENAKDGYTTEDVLDTHMLLGRLCMMNSQYKRAIVEYSKAVEIAKKEEKPNSWRLVSSALVLLGGAYEARERPKKGLEIFNEVLNIIEKQQSNANEEEKADIDGIKEVVLERINNLKEDIKEQEENKEDIKEEEEDLDEEEEENGEEEEGKETIAEEAPIIDSANKEEEKKEEEKKEEEKKEDKKE